MTATSARNTNATPGPEAKATTSIQGVIPAAMTAGSLADRTGESAFAIVSFFGSGAVDKIPALFAKFEADHAAAKRSTASCLATE